MPVFMMHLNWALGWALMRLGLISGGRVHFHVSRKSGQAPPYAAPKIEETLPKPPNKAATRIQGALEA